MQDVKHGYKAFEPGLVCRGKQYAENTTFEEEGGHICFVPVCVKAAQVDGETLKPDTFYKLENGAFVEA